MELHQLRYLLAVAEAGSFTRAARECGIAQPSLSQQIQKLEKELRQPLFDRLPRGAVLTDAGQRLLPQARDILSAVDRAEATTKQGGEAVGGTLSVGAIPTMAPYLLPGVVKQFLRRFPAVTLRLHEDMTVRLVDRLAAGSLDLAFTSLPMTHPLLHADHLAEEELFVAVPREHALAQRKKVAWADVADEPFLVLQEMHCLSGQATGFCRQQGNDPRVVMRGEQLHTILDLVALGMGISLVPAMAVKADRSSKRVYLPFRDDPPTRAIAAVWHLHRYRTAAAREFVKMVAGEGAKGPRD
jgi:molybdate transport repressor ModE-like protein